MGAMLSDLRCKLCSLPGYVNSTAEVLPGPTNSSCDYIVYQFWRFWGWWITIKSTGFLDCIHRLVFNKKGGGGERETDRGQETTLEKLDLLLYSRERVEKSLARWIRYKEVLCHWTQISIPSQRFIRGQLFDLGVQWLGEALYNGSIGGGLPPFHLKMGGNPVFRTLYSLFF